MKRNFRKAMAFAMAAAMVGVNLGVTVPVIAAEYSEVEKVLATEYDTYGRLGDSVYFGSYVEEENEEGLTTRYLDEIVVVDKNGETSSLEVKNTDGEYKYKDISLVPGDCVALIQPDESYVLLYEDGSYFGAGEEKYDDIFILEDGNYLVRSDTICKVVDKTGAVIAADIFEPVSCDKMYWWPYYEFNKYIVLGRQIYSEDGGYVSEVKLFDSYYNEVEGMEFDDASVGVIGDYLVVYTDKDVNIYDENLEKVDFAYRGDDLHDSSEVEENEHILCDYKISGVYGDYEYGDDNSYFEIYIDHYYEDSTGENYYYSVRNMYDCDTFEKLSNEDIDDSSSDEMNVYSIDNTDVTCKFNEETYVKEYYYNSKLIFNAYDLYEYVISEKALENTTGYYISETGIDDGIFFGVGIWLEDESMEEYTVLVTKDTGYSLDNASVYNKRIYYYYQGKLPLVIFDDFTCYFKGEFYDSIDAVNVYTRYDENSDELVTYAYSLRAGEEDAYTWKLYDMDDNVIAEIPEIINAYTESGIIVTKKNVENEDGSEECYFGCYYLGKVLTSSEEVLEELSKVEEGDSIEVKLDKNEPVKAEVLENIKGKDIEIVLTTGSGFKWSINGKDVKDTELKDIDLTVDIAEDIIPTEAIKEVDIKGDKIEFTIAHTGEFGFKAKLTFNVKAENKDKYANRFYYNPNSKKLEFQESVKIDANGDVAFNFTHASEYVIFISDTQYVDDATDDKITNDKTTDDKTDIPDTGDTTESGMLVAVIVIAAGAFVLTQTKKSRVK